MRKPYIVASLKQGDDLQWSIDRGMLAFAVFPEDAMLSFEELGMCENTCVTYETLKRAVNQPDILHGSPGLEPNLPCNALSASITFEARQATATKANAVTVAEPVKCPNPRNPRAPRQGCDCESTCFPPPGG
jgi:hypothetical protein